MMEYVMGENLRIHEETGGSVFPHYINFTFNTGSGFLASQIVGSGIRFPGITLPISVSMLMITHILSDFYTLHK